MKQWKTRLIFMASFLVIGAAALVLYSCGGGGGGGSSSGGGSTQIQTASQGAQAAATSVTAVTSVVGSVGNLGISFTKPLLNAAGKTLLGPRHYKDSRAKLAADIRGKMMASQPMQKKMALMKSHIIKAKTVRATLTTISDWFPCDNYDGTDLDQSGNPLDPTTAPNGTKGYSISSFSTDPASTTIYGGGTESKDVDCQTYTKDQGGNITGLTRLNGVSTFSQTNYTQTTNPDGSANWSLSFSGTDTGLAPGEPHVFETYTNPTPSTTPPTDLTTLTKDSFLESDFDLTGSYSDASTLDSGTGATTDNTTHNLTMNKGTEHFGSTDTTGSTDLTFAYTGLSDNGTENLTDDNAGTTTDNTNDTINGGFNLNLTVTAALKPTAAKASRAATTEGFSASLSSFNYKDNYSTAPNSVWDDFNEYSGSVKVTLTPADACFDGTFAITTETPVHTSSTALPSTCPIGGHITINGGTTVTYNVDGSVDVSVGGGSPTHYATCADFEAQVCPNAGVPTL